MERKLQIIFILKIYKKVHLKQDDLICTTQNSFKSGQTAEGSSEKSVGKSKS